MGYPDGWNQLAYCGNGVTGAVDLWGCETVYLCQDDCRRGDISHPYKTVAWVDPDRREVYPVEIDHNPPDGWTSDQIRAVLNTLSGLDVHVLPDKVTLVYGGWDEAGRTQNHREGNYECSDITHCRWEINQVDKYVKVSKSTFLSRLGQCAGGVGTALSLVELFFPEIAIPASISNGLTIIGLCDWLDSQIHEMEAVVRIDHNFKFRYTGDFKRTYSHRWIGE